MTHSIFDPNDIGTVIDQLAERHSVPLSPESRQSMVDTLTMFGFTRGMLACIDALLQYRSNVLADGYRAYLGDWINDPTVAAEEIRRVADRIPDSDRPIGEITEITAMCFAMSEHFADMMDNAAEQGVAVVEVAEKSTGRLGGEDHMPAGYHLR